MRLRPRRKKRSQKPRDVQHEHHADCPIYAGEGVLESHVDPESKQHVEKCINDYVRNKSHFPYGSSIVPYYVVGPNGVGTTTFGLDIDGRGTDGLPPDFDIPEELTPVVGSPGNTYDVVFHTNEDGLILGVRVLPKNSPETDPDEDFFDSPDGVHRVLVSKESWGMTTDKYGPPNEDERFEWSKRMQTKFKGCGVLRGPWHGSGESLQQLLVLLVALHDKEVLEMIFQKRL